MVYKSLSGLQEIEFQGIFHLKTTLSTSLKPPSSSQSASEVRGKMKKARIFTTLIILFTIGINLSCSQEAAPEASAKFSVWASLKTTSGTGSEAKILLEGADGNLISGSSVSIDNGEGGYKDVFSGQRLLKNTVVSVGWKKVQGATVYMKEIRKGSTNVFAASSAEEYLVIPAEILTEAGMYSIRIIAQYNTGDPYYINSDYWSFSEFTGSSILFEIE